MNESDDDVIPIGRLRRPGRPSVAVSYDPLWGLRVEDEDAPKEADAAAAWIRRAASPTVAEFLRAWRKHG